MKSLTLILTAIALISSPALHAVQGEDTGSINPGSSAAAASNSPSAWGTALLGIAIIAAIAGVSAVSGSREQPSFGH